MDQGEILRVNMLSQRQLMIDDLQQDYGLSPVEAEVLYDRITLFSQATNPNGRGEQQILVTAVAKGEPAGKPLKLCKKIQVKISIMHPDDLVVRKRFGVMAERQAKLVRVAEEGIEHGGTFSVERLAHMFGVSKSTIKRDKQRLKAKGIHLPTRGEVEAIGPCQTHKAKAIDYLLKGYSLEETSWRLHHSPESITRYWESFGAVAYLHEKGFSIHTIRKLVKISERVIREYLVLKKEAQDEGRTDQLQLVMKRYEDLNAIKQKGGIRIHKKKGGPPLTKKKRRRRRGKR